MLHNKTYHSSESIDTVMLLCTIIKDFFRFLNDQGIALPYEAKYYHLESYQEQLKENGLDEKKIAYAIAAIRQFYSERLNQPFSKQ